MKKQYSGGYSTPQRWLCALLSVLMISGCAAMEPSLKKYDKPADQCNTYRKPLIETETDLRNWVFGGAAVGAGAAAAGTALAGGDLKDVLIGAAAGAAAGALGGYLYGRRQETKSKEELIAAISNDAASDSEKVRVVRAAVENLWQCRQQEIESVSHQVQQGQLSKADALARADQIQVSMNDDSSLIAAVMGRVDKRFNTYVEARAEVLGVDRETVLSDAARESATPQPLPKTSDYQLLPASGKFKLKTDANIRSAPSTQSEKITAFKAGQTIEVNGRTQDGQWYAVKNGQQPAFIYASLVEKITDQPPPGDPLGNLAAETQEVKKIQEQEKTRTERDLESLRILLSCVPRGIDSAFYGQLNRFYRQFYKFNSNHNSTNFDKI